MDNNLGKRVIILKKGNHSKGPVVYWMSRDQRVDNNWALLFALRLALENNAAMAVVFCVVPQFLEATLRHYGFMIKGLQQVKVKLEERNIPFYLLAGNPEQEIAKFCDHYKVSHLVTDFDPLKVKRVWKKEICDKVDASVYTVDAHNIVPAFYVSAKAEYGAYTIRPKLKKLLPEFLTSFPGLDSQKHYHPFEFTICNWEQVLNELNINREVKEVDWCLPGEHEALKMVERFIHEKLENYFISRNDPSLHATSDLSPYLHFGQISAQHIAFLVLKTALNSESSEAFLEELIVRRELSDNFCLYNSNYDSFEGFPQWAQNTLNEHRKDNREFVYSPEQFEKAQTHDKLWNAAQMEMVKNGKMHGYMRMYWAKKILEWTASPEDALRIAIFLNDKYELDGRDPNGYAGCAWAIGGVHDRTWSKRSVFGSIRYMNYNGCKRKFNVDNYIEGVRDRNAPNI